MANRKCLKIGPKTGTQVTASKSSRMSAIARQRQRHWGSGRWAMRDFIPEARYLSP
jgi:hypothetical protein